MTLINAQTMEQLRPSIHSPQHKAQQAAARLTSPAVSIPMPPLPRACSKEPTPWATSLEVIRQSH